MDKYRKVQKEKVVAETSEEEIRLTAQGSITAYVSRAATVFNELGKPKIELKAIGSALTKAVTSAEVIKRRFKGLHQVTVIGNQEIVDEYEPIEEGLENVTETRQIPSITITLSKEPLDTSAAGYQPPIDESLVKDVEPEELTRARGRGRGKGRGGEKGKGKGKDKGKGKGKGKDDKGKGKGKGKEDKGKGKGKGKDDKGKGNAWVREDDKGKGKGKDDKGKGKGKGKGKDDSKGKGKGKDKGYDRGYDREYDRGYDSKGWGKDRGYDRSYDRGYDRGYDRSYDRGYDSKGKKGSSKGKGKYSSW